MIDKKALRATTNLRWILGVFVSGVDLSEIEHIWNRN